MTPTRADYKHSHLLSVELQELLDVCKYNVLPASQVFWQFSDIVHCRHVMLCVCVCVCVCVLEWVRVHACVLDVWGERNNRQLLLHSKWTLVFRTYFNHQLHVSNIALFS